MKKKWVFMLVALIIFFGWFIYSLFYSTGEEWWTLYYLEQIESDVFVAHISWVKVLASGLIIFIPLFRLLYFQINCTPLIMIKNTEIVKKCT